jgi:hypothetical protein
LNTILEIFDGVTAHELINSDRTEKGRKSATRNFTEVTCQQSL